MSARCLAAIDHGSRGTHEGRQLLYFATFAPDKGESVSALMKNLRPGAPVSPILPLQDGFLFLESTRTTCLPTPTRRAMAGGSVGSDHNDDVLPLAISRAQQLLESTDLPIEQVAAEVGFGSAAVMREHFGTVVGTSPQSYRRAFSTVARSA